MIKKSLLIFSSALFCCGISSAITPNQLLSRGLKAYTSDGENTYITDGTLTGWKRCTSEEIALNVGSGAEKLLVTWESCGDYAWATDFTTGCSHNGTPLKNFTIKTSANSTNGFDGDWESVATIENNPVMARGIFIDFHGQSWVKIISEEEVGEILEIEIFDMTQGGDDTWFFMGTSISQMGIKQQNTDTTTADLIHARFPNFTPAMLRGGIGCINSSEVVARLSDYLKYAGNVKYWAIEMGTNDAWGGGDWNLNTFKNNMQTIIDSAKSNGIEPILARIIATDETKAGWQVNEKFLQVIDELTESNNLNKGPDFYNYFLAHPELIASDGVHPNGEAGGGQAMHHLWAEALAPLYMQSEGDGTQNREVQKSLNTSIPQIFLQNKIMKIIGLEGESTSIDIYNASGYLMEHQQTSSTSFEKELTFPNGTYIVVVKTARCSFSSKLVIAD